MSPTDPAIPSTPPTCHDCGATLSTLNPLGGGLCESCLWRGLSQPPEPGPSPYRDLVPGHEIIEELGRGGMGVVYRAHQLSPSREVALKMLLPLDSGQIELRARFQQEARTLADLEHPAILPLYQVGETEGMPYFTMKLAAGGTLARRLTSGGAWSALRAAELTAVLADALHYAHMRGVIHRDLKPGNILFDEAGRPYLADFGLAKLEDSRATYSRSAGVLGTPAYLAPEIASSGARAATTASDIYSLGSVFFELLTGRPPFTVEGLAALLVKIAEEAPPTPTSLNAQIPRDLEIVCLKCLRKSPTDRYASAAEFAEDLRRWIRGEPVRARQFTPAERLVKWARRRPALAGLSATLALTVVGAGVGLTHKNRQLNKALQQVKAAQARAAQRAEFYVGTVADRIEALGRLDILNDAYEDVLQTETDPDDASRSRRVLVLTQLGRSLFLQNRHADARAPLTEAVQLAAALPPTPEFHALHADASAALAVVISETGTFEEAVAVLTAAENRLQSMTALAPPVRAEALGKLAEAYTEVGLATVRSSKEVQAQAARAVAHRREAWNLTRSDTARLALCVSLRKQAETLVREAKLAAEKNRHDDARPAWEAARSLFEEALTTARNRPTAEHASAAWEREEAFTLGSLAETVSALEPGRAGEALAWLIQERDYFRRAVKEDPLNWRTNYELINALDNLAKACKEMKLSPALEDEARLEQEALLADGRRRAPVSRTWMLGNMNHSLALGRWHLDRGRPGPADDHFRTTMTTAERLVDMRPTHRYDQRGFRDTLELIREAWEKSGNYQKSREVLERGLAYAQKQAAAGPATDAFQWISGFYHRRLAEWSEHQGDPEAALTHNLRALNLRADQLRAWTVPAQVDHNAIPNSYLQSELSYVALDRRAEAVALAHQALDLRREVAQRPIDPTSWAFAIVAASATGIQAGGKTEIDARRLAARALADLYPEGSGSSAPALAPYQPKPEDAARFARDSEALRSTLKVLAGPQPAPAP